MASYKICTGTQDRQKGQCMDMQITIGRIVKTKLYSTKGTAGIT